ncbi:UNVERIFIED_CONTAM: queG [Trichonephila clavipes]
MASTSSSHNTSQKIEIQQLDPQELKTWIKAQALELGFSDCVIAKPDAQDQMPRFKEYLKRGYHADMHYLEENLDKRADPTLLVPGTKSIICVRMNYLVASPKPRELFTSLDLPFDQPATAHCGSCTACIDICPTQAIVEPYMLDARKCIAYLTIEYKGIIPEEYRAGIGNRIFGCDDCQLICPWNGFAKTATIPDFDPRHSLDNISLLDIWQWDEATFLANTEGSPIRRTGYQSFKRNIAIGLGNAPYSNEIIAKLQEAKPWHDEIVNVHIDWAIQQQLRQPIVHHIEK